MIGAGKCRQRNLSKKFKHLPPEKIIEAEDFVEFLRMRSTMQEHVKAENERAAQLREVAESMRANTFNGCAPHFSRDELHERR
jgi:hypothetical protein